MIKAEHAGDTCSAFSDVVNFVVGRTQDFAGSAVVVDVPGVRVSKVSVLMFLLGVSACKSPPPVQSQRPEPAAWAMEKAQDLQQMLNSIITVSEVESTG